MVYTDVWASMGQKEEAAERKRVFQGFQVRAAHAVLFSSPGPHASLCCPAKNNMYTSSLF